MSDYTPPVPAVDEPFNLDDFRVQETARPQGFADTRGGPPPNLGKTPTSAKQLLFPSTVTPTRFTGPVLSGGKGEVAVGSAILQLPLWIDYTMGSFSLPIQFQQNTVLMWIMQMAYTAFSGGAQATSVALGTNQGGAQIAIADGFDGLHLPRFRNVIGTLPFAIDPNPFQAWITVAQYNNTAGRGVVLIGYARI